MTKLKASSLFYAITIALLVGTVMSSMVLLTHFKDLRAARWCMHERVAENARSAAYLSLFKGQPDEGPRSYGLFNDGTDSVSVEVRSYGGLDLIITEAWQADQSVFQTAVAGYSFDDRVVLDLSGGKAPLHVCGVTRIRGNVRLPQADVRRGHIEGKPFVGEELVHGNVIKAAPEQTLLRDGLEKRISHMVNNGTLVGEGKLMPAGTMHFGKTDGLGDAVIPVLEFHGRSYLSGYDLQGPIVIRCNDTITIGSKSKLELAIIQAPFIEIDPDFMGSIQCFASRGIVLGERAQLMFPSLLSVWRDDRLSDAAFVQIKDDALVQGAVIAVDRSIRDRHLGSISIGLNARVYGEVYAEGGIELRGTVQGTVTANEIVLRTPASVYRGHLLDATLEQYGPGRPWGFGCITNNEERCIIQWNEPVHLRRES